MAVNQKYVFKTNWQPTPPVRVFTTATGRAGEGEGDGKITLRYKTGDVVIGTEYPEGQYLVTMPAPNIYVNIPYSVLQKHDGSPSGNQSSGGVKKPFLTPAAKVGLGVLGGVALLIIAIKFWK